MGRGFRGQETEVGYGFPRYTSTEVPTKTGIMENGQIVRVTKGRWKGYVGTIVVLHLRTGGDLVTVQITTDKKLKDDVAHARLLDNPTYRNETNNRWIEIPVTDCSLVAEVPDNVKYPW
jgi:hypothetical protein